MGPEPSSADVSRRRPWRALAIYGLMIAVAAVLFLLIRSYGETLAAPAGTTQAIEKSPIVGGSNFLRVLVALAAILVLGQVLARVFAYIGQPPVIGEVVAGILLGPSLIGPETSALVLPPSVAPSLGVIAQLGVVLYMFLVGLEVNPALLRQQARATVAMSVSSILLPFVLGAGLALYLYPRLSSSNVAFTNFALFMGVAMSITAFPVLARILSDYGMTRSRLGVLALACAAINDVTAWCLLALVVGLVSAQISDGLMVVAGAAAFTAFMFLAARPVLDRITHRYSSEAQSRALLPLIFAALLLSALAAEAIGIHAIFGAFLLGAVIPHDSTVAKALLQQLERLVTILLLPAFFAYTGMRTRIDLISAPEHWLLCLLVIAVAIFGKFTGTFAAARITGLNGRDSAILGTLMNTRGLMELIVLNVGLELGVISPLLFSIMVLMALVTTALTSPVLLLLKAKARIDGPGTQST